jgi:hypothetical protein
MKKILKDLPKIPNKKVHNAFREAINPAEALKEMKDDYKGNDGVAFSSEEVVEYVKNKVGDAADENPRTQRDGSKSSFEGSEMRKNFEYIVSEVTDSSSLPFIGNDEYRSSDFEDEFESYVKEQLFKAADVDGANVEGTTYFEAESNAGS